MLTKTWLIGVFLIGLSFQTSCPPGYQFEGSLTMYPQGTCIGLASSTALTMEANEKICASYGGHLSKITNIFDNVLLEAYFEKFISEADAGQLGLKMNGTYWYWTDGTSVTYSNWAHSSDGDCAYMFFESGYWYSYPCDTQRYRGLCMVPANNCPSGWSYFSQTGQCYYHGRNATLDQATQVCASKNGQLASIHSQAENQFVSDLITVDKCRGISFSPFYETQVILGGYLNSTTSGRWIDGTVFDFFADDICYFSQSSITPIILMDGGPDPCNYCGDHKAWVSSPYNLTSTYVYPGYICKAPPLPTSGSLSKQH